MNKMKRSIKRMTVYLLLGFVMSWLVAWGLAFVPHRAEPLQYAYARPFEMNSSSYFGGYILFYDYRWFGITEHVYASPGFKQLEDSPVNQPYWWWSAGREYLGTTEEWADLKTEFVGVDDDFLSEDDKLVEKIIPGSSLRDRTTLYSTIRYGFPFFSHQTRGAAYRNHDLPDGTKFAATRGALLKPAANIERSAQMAQYTYLPYAPLWRGMLLNTLIYALIFFILGSIKHAYRHARYFRRLCKGKCPICAYDLRFDNTLGCPECGWRKKLVAHA